MPLIFALQSIEKVVSTKVAHLSLKARLTIEDIEKLLFEIEEAVENEWNSKSATYLADFFFAPPMVKIAILCTYVVELLL